jgi:hypothetical protein
LCHLPPVSASRQNLFCPPLFRFCCRENIRDNKKVLYNISKISKLGTVLEITWSWLQQSHFLNPAIYQIWHGGKETQRKENWVGLTYLAPESRGGTRRLEHKHANPAMMLQVSSNFSCLHSFLLTHLMKW